ncbi:MAG: TIGR04053 family radical SAM/SPASM domain-containing protein [Acidobacteriota bacterium]
MDQAGRTETSSGARQKFALSPLVVIWEVTRACDLACVHCRASAIPERETGELTTGEGLALIEQVRGFGKPVFVLTGGDPLKRQDIFDLIRSASASGLPTYMSPSGTPLLTHAGLLRARDSGLLGVSISLDGSTEEIHDRFRGVRGSFRLSLDAAASAVALGLRLQINTTLTRHNLEDLPAIADLVGSLEARRWTVFLLVPTGRALSSQQVSPDECEEVFAWLYELSKKVPFRIKTTEGPHYRRVALQRSGASCERADNAVVVGTGSGGGRFVPGMNDGSGFLFISSKGAIHPSGFLPLPAGNVRTDSLTWVYREHPLFVALRDPERLSGRCGRCEFRAVCGGSRARAFALTGDVLADDPACAYDPGKSPGASARAAS